MSAWHWYTKARRIPTLIGKDAAGRRIPGGPYTALQAIAALVTPAVTWSTRALWTGQLTGLATMIVVLGLSFGVVKLLGKVDFASRNPLLLTSSFLRQLISPPGGTLAGTALRPLKARRIRSSVVVGRLTEAPPPAAATDRQPAAATAAAVTAHETVPAPRRGSASTTSASGARSGADATTSGFAMPGPAEAAERGNPRAPGRLVAASNGFQPRSADSAPRRSGLEAFLSSTDNQEEAA